MCFQQVFKRSFCAKNSSSLFVSKFWKIKKKISFRILVSCSKLLYHFSSFPSVFSLYFFFKIFVHLHTWTFRCKSILWDLVLWEVFCLWSFEITKYCLWSLDHQVVIFSLCFAPTFCVEVCERELELCTPCLYRCNSSVEAPLWKILYK